MQHLHCMRTGLRLEVPMMKQQQQQQRQRQLLKKQTQQQLAKLRRPLMLVAVAVVVVVVAAVAAAAAVDCCCYWCLKTASVVSDRRSAGTTVFAGQLAGSRCYTHRQDHRKSSLRSCRHTERPYSLRPDAFRGGAGDQRDVDEALCINRATTLR